MNKKATAEDFSPDKIPLNQPARTVYKCGECGQVQAHDYIPYSLGKGVWYNNCICFCADSNWIHRAKSLADYEK